jgi:hypothetical protein
MGTLIRDFLHITVYKDSKFSAQFQYLSEKFIKKYGLPCPFGQRRPQQRMDFWWKATDFA